MMQIPLPLTAISFPVPLPLVFRSRSQSRGPVNEVAVTHLSPSMLTALMSIFMFSIKAVLYEWSIKTFSSTYYIVAFVPVSRGEDRFWSLRRLANFVTSGRVWEPLLTSSAYLSAFTLSAGDFSWSRQLKPRSRGRLFVTRTLSLATRFHF